MNILDENFPEPQRQLLSSWRILHRQIGLDVGRDGMKDPQIILMLLQYKRPTFFTLDIDFYRPALRHKSYCLVCLGGAQIEAARFVRQVLRHPMLNTQAKRMGKVLRASHTGLTIWNIHATDYEEMGWLNLHG